MIASLIPSSLILQSIKTLNPLIFFNKKPKTLISRAESTSSNNPNVRNPTPSNNNTKPNRKNPRKSKYGTSRRSILKKSLKQEQLIFTTPISEDPVVAIIGGGVSGLICALNLEKRGIRSTVFDTGIHGLGGRMGTRVIDPQPLVFDHAAQFFTASDSWFAELVDGWLKKGLVREWQGPVGEIEAGGPFVEIPHSSPRYIGVNGMRPLADSILSQTSMVNVERSCWISKLEAFNGMWYLSENGKPRGQFDAVVIAHNGKCANRLLGSSGLPLIAKQMKRLELSAIWALLAAFEDPLPIPCSTSTTPFEGAFVKGVDALSWMANNTKKLFPSTISGPQCWTFFSTGAYGKRNKVPQENIPNATADKVKEGMLEAVEITLGLSKGSLQRPFYSRVQLWGAALPTNTPGVPCIFDAQGRAGICGDWLLGSSLEAAALSGLALSNHMADYLQSGATRPDEFSVGLHDEFRPIGGYEIGQFPGMESRELVK
ncbi:hypothetical protein GIB67_027158 [Kingdonia uniflora]|uniref:FAD/NAD(P)-binding oxidoreductase family protein n=1 Tax=Kingdonia uniflora TaxID=39325 RepID=A0A7J7P2B5_9MAGN|nr:hypothetical protein GIB67_027158 [Kingdonia uniflora]